MIRLIRNDGIEILLNTTMIQHVASSRDGGTVITLGTGENITVKNTRSDIAQKIDAYRMGKVEDARKEKEKEKALEKDKEKDKDKDKAKDKDRTKDKDKDKEKEKSSQKRSEDRK